MTHLSDFSYLHRGITSVALLSWCIYRAWSVDRFRSLHPRRFRQGELKSIVTVLVFLMFPFQLYYDAVTTRIKYDEGFANLFGHIITKPELAWTEADKKLITPTEYSFCVGMALQAGNLFLFQCFWNYLSNAVVRESFMSSKEFKFYIMWSVVSIVGLPFILFNFSRDIYAPIYKEAMPILVFGIEYIIISFMGIMSHYRFSKLLKKSQNATNSHIIQEKILHFQQLNVIMSLAIFIFGVSIVILAADSLTPRKRLNANKFSCDFLILNVTTSSDIIWIVVMVILYPQAFQHIQESEDYVSDISVEKEFVLAPSADVQNSNNETPMIIPMGAHGPIVSKTLRTGHGSQVNETVVSSALSSVTLVSPSSQFARQGSSSKDTHDHLDNVSINDRSPFDHDNTRKVTTVTSFSRRSPYSPHRDSAEMEVPGMSPQPTSPRHSTCNNNEPETSHDSVMRHSAGPSVPPAFTESQLPSPPQIRSTASHPEHSGQIRRQSSFDSMWLTQSPRNPAFRPN